MAKHPSHDFAVHNEGSIFLLEPLSDDAQNWIEEHIPGDAQYFGNSVAIEHRYVIDVIDGIHADGYTIQGDNDV
jgi:hypothetical protein